MNNYTFHVANSTVCAIISVAANITLLVISLKERNTILRGYRRMIVTVCINDLMFTFFMFISQQEAKYTQGYAVMFTYTPLRHLGLNWIYFLSVMNITMMGLASTSMLLIFYFRYQMICKHHTMTVMEIVNFMSFASIWALWDALCALYGAFETRASDPTIERLFVGHSDWYENGKPLVAPIVYKKSVGCLMLTGFGTVLVFGSYLGALVFGRKVYVHLSTHQHIISGRTRKLQNSITKVMIVQALIPFFNCSVPIGMVFIAFLRSNDAPLTWFLLGNLTSWIPVLNSTSTILLVGPFRRKVFNYYFRPFNGNKTSDIYKTSVTAPR